MAASLLSSRPSSVSSTFASVPSARQSSASSTAAGAPSTSNPRRKTAAAATRRFNCVVRGGAHRCTSQFHGIPVPVTRVSTPRTSRPCAWSTGSPVVASSSSYLKLVQKVTAKELDSILSAERTSPMIIDFYATWCGPCVVLAQELELLAVEFGREIKFLKVDTDEEHELASQMEIRGLPTLVFVSKDVDKLAIRTEGLLPTKAIRDIIEKEILVR